MLSLTHRYPAFPEREFYRQMHNYDTRILYHHSQFFLFLGRDPDAIIRIILCQDKRRIS